MTQRRQVYGQSPVQDILRSSDSVYLWGHSIDLADSDSICCTMCDMEKEIPELLQESSGFREVVYLLYLLGEFRQTRCDGSEYELDQSVLHDTVTNVPVDPNKTYWSDTKTTNNINTGSGDTVDLYIPQGQRMMMDGTEYIYHGDGTWRDTDRNIALGTVDLIEKHGKEAKQKFPPEVVHEKQKMLDNRKKMLAQNGSIDTVSASDLQDAGPPSLQDNSVGIVNGGSSITTDTNQDPDVDGKSVVKEWAESVKNARNKLTR